jgi:toxin-antitoxin system PIN domain toxin
VSRAGLLDVNVLIALFDPDHIHHEQAHHWFADHRYEGWATCPLTENGVVRILSNPAYSPAAERPARIVERLGEFCSSGDHEFWPDDVSLCDPAAFQLTVGHSRLTDVYLLALARAHGGRLVTFDRSIPVNEVRGARGEHLLVVQA